MKTCTLYNQIFVLICCFGWETSYAVRIIHFTFNWILCIFVWKQETCNRLLKQNKHIQNIYTLRTNHLSRLLIYLLIINCNLDQGPIFFISSRKPVLVLDLCAIILYLINCPWIWYTQFSDFSKKLYFATKLNIKKLYQKFPRNVLYIMFKLVW